MEWRSSLLHSRLAALTQESDTRFRLVFAGEHDSNVLVASLDPGRPWLAAETRRWIGPRWSPAPWVVAAAHDLVGRRLEAIEKLPADRCVRFDFGDGRGLAIYLTPNRSNFAVLGEQGKGMPSLRRSRPSEFPPDRCDPFSSSPETIDAMRDRLLGVGTLGVELAAEESRLSGLSFGAVLRARLDAVLAGESEVLIDGDRLLPWRPPVATPGQPLSKPESPAITASLFYERREVAFRVDARIASLGGILRKELSRARNSGRKVREELRSFGDPDRQRLMGEALLSGLTVARRTGDVVLVPDPYDENGGDVAIPAPADRSLSQVADDLFRKHRKFRRGLAATQARAESLERREGRLEALLVQHERVQDEAGADELEEHMRAFGLPVGLAGPTRAARKAASVEAPRLAGVRMVTSADGWTILIGRTGPDNDRLTFKIATPEDFWLHAAGAPGAHVVIRNPDRAARPPTQTLSEAAAHALWFSDARPQGVADVQWTRRKNVRRAKGGSSGQVILKRFETIRVNAKAPPHDS